MADGAVDAVRHLRIAGKDHLMTVDAEGAVRLFDRKGNAREAVAVRSAGADGAVPTEPPVGDEQPERASTKANDNVQRVGRNMRIGCGAHPPGYATRPSRRGGGLPSAGFGGRAVQAR